MIKKYYKLLLKYILLWKWQILFVLGLIYIFFDYFDFGILIGWGVFSIQYKSSPVEAVVAIFLLLTLYATWRSSKEALRQTELTLRPYLRLSWDSSQIGDNRRVQGITDTCLVASNNGNGLMRKIKYSVMVGKKKVEVRNHSLIIPGSSTNVVYDDKINNAGPVLGCRNDKDFENKNNEIIKNTEIEIRVSGSYRDIEGRKYRFSFSSNPSDQSWFSENYIQGIMM